MESHIFLIQGSVIKVFKSYLFFFGKSLKLTACNTVLLRILADYKLEFL